MYIQPTIGRMVWYRPLEWDDLTGQPSIEGRPSPSDGFVSAQVCSVEHPGSDARGPSPDYAVVNLVVADRYGITKSRRDVTLRHDINPEGREACPPGVAVWMPYQKGQAARTEQVEANVGGRESAHADDGMQTNEAPQTPPSSAASPQGGDSDVAGGPGEDQGEDPPSVA